MKKKETEWKRKCPRCDRELKYSTKYNMIEAEEKGRYCRKCGKTHKNKNFFRICPKCNDERIWYKHKKDKNRAENNNIWCRRCIGKGLGSPMKYLNFEFSEDHRRKIGIRSSERQLGKKYPEKRVRNMVEGLVKIPYDEYIKSVPLLKRYRKEVLKYTRVNDLSILLGYDDKENHLDHIFPIAEGFKRNIPAKLLGNIKNLQYINGIKNREKYNKITHIPQHIKDYINEN